jgi:hypothetical protein
MKLSAIIKGSICLLGFVGVGNLLAAPANADQAAARAATSITNPSSFTQSVSGEVLLPSGLFFGGADAVEADVDTGVIGTPEGTLTVLPNVSVSTNEEGSPGTTTAKIIDLSLNAGEAMSVNEVAGEGSISHIVAHILNGTNSNLPEDAEEGDEDTAINAETIDDAAAIIKAAAGVNGLD